MRITNKIMQMNSLSNINTNKLNEDTLNNQMASGKKVLRPSDDPVLAIRSLRLRTTLTDITQYLEKNVEDADSWLKVTEDSINTVNNCLEDAISQCNKGAVDHLTTENRNIILDDLRSLKNEIYASGDADYAGRGVFTGYRTSTKLLFQTNEKVRYDINEPLRKDAVEEFTYVKLNAEGGKSNVEISHINAGNYTSEDYPLDTDIYDKKVYRLRLSYQTLDNPLSYDPATGDPLSIFSADSNNKADRTPEGNIPQISYVGFPSQEYQIPIAVISINDKKYDPYIDVDNAALENEFCYRDAYGNVLDKAGYDALTGDYYKDEKGNVLTQAEYSALTEEERTKYISVPGKVSDKGPKAIFIPETGEIILNEAAKNIVASLNDYSFTEGIDEGKLSIKYSKTSFEKGDLRPEHYFECTQYVTDKKTILHNQGGITDAAESQVISYDVGFNQEIRVNTIAPDIYDPSIVRDIDDLIDIIEQVSAVESTISSLESEREKIDPTDAERLKKIDECLAAAKKAYTMLEDKMQKLFEGGITKFKEHQRKATLALTEVGTRTSKLSLVKSRLGSQQTNFKELVANNDQVDIAEVATMLKSAQLAYDASLQATAKINQTTLLNYL